MFLSVEEMEKERFMLLLLSEGNLRRSSYGFLAYELVKGLVLIISLALRSK